MTDEVLVLDEQGRLRARVGTHPPRVVEVDPELRAVLETAVAALPTMLPVRRLVVEEGVVVRRLRWVSFEVGPADLRWPSAVADALRRAPALAACTLVPRGS